MRFWLACVLYIISGPTLGFSQVHWAPSDGFMPRHSPPIPSINPPLPLFGESVYGGRCYGPRVGAGYQYGGNYGSGFGYSGYTSITYGTPGFSVGYSGPLYGNSYYGPNWGYSGWQAPVYVASPVFITQQPAPPPPLPQWMLDEATIGANRGVKAKPISQTHRSLIPPSTPEAQLRSIRLQDAGDRLFSALDYAAAEKSFAKSIQAAPDRPEPYVRLAVTQAARGDFRGAVSQLKQMADVDPRYPDRAESLGRLFGHRNGISKLQLKQRVADWTKIDVRDPDRIFLLGIMLFLDGDDRFRTLLDTAVKLEGDQPHLQAFLAALPAQDEAAAAPTPDEIDARAGTEPRRGLPDDAEAGVAPQQTGEPLLLPPRLPEPPAP